MKKNLFFRSLRVESLESRKLLSAGSIFSTPVATMVGPMQATVSTLQQQLAALQAQLAGGGGGSQMGPAPLTVTQPTIQANNNWIPTLDILPGAQNKLIADYTFNSQNRAYGQLDELILLSAVGSATSAANFTIKADLDGNVQNGCETVIGNGSPDYNTGVADITMSCKNDWVRLGQTLHVQVYGNVNSWMNTGDTKLGVELASAGFRDLRGNPVSDSSVNYVGTNPILHTLESATLNVSQQTSLPYASANAGDKGVVFLKGNLNGNNSTVDTLTFGASAGNLSDGANFTLRYDTNYDGSYNSSVVGAVSGGKLIFNLTPQKVSSGEFEVTGDVVAAPTGKILAVAFPGTSGCVTGHNVVTGKPLQGIWVAGPNSSPSAPINGYQIQLYCSASFSTTYNLVTKPADLVVTESGGVQEWSNVQTANAGDDIIVDSGMLATSSSNLIVNHMAFVTVNGTSFGVASSNYSLWLDGNNVSTGVFVGTQLLFDKFTATVSPGTNVVYEVHATAPDPLPNTSLQVQLAGPSATTPGITATKNGVALTVDKVFEQTAWSPMWMLGSYGLG